MDKKEEEALKKINESLLLLDKDIVKAVNEYFKRGHINIASLVGILSHHQYTLNNIGIRVNERVEEQKDLSKVDYIG